MTKKFLPYTPSQVFLFPQNPRDWLPAGHRAYLIEDALREDALSEFYGGYAEGSGAPPFDPRMMLGVLIYAYSRGVRSSRVISRLCEEDVGFRVLAGHVAPAHSAFCQFRTRHLTAFEALFTRVLLLCREAGLVKLGHVALDGSKVAANASKQKAMSLKRLGEETTRLGAEVDQGEAQQEEDVREEARLREEVQKMLREAQDADAHEDSLYGEKRGDELPPALQDRALRLKKFEEAREALRKKKERLQTLQGAHKELVGREQRDIQENPDRRDKEPRENAQINFTDGDSRIMPDSSHKGSFTQAYNPQIAVDAESQVIVGKHMAQSPIDNPQLAHVIEDIKNQNDGQLPGELSADAGYARIANLKLLEDLKIEGYVSLRKQKRDVPDEASTAPYTEDDPRERMRQKLATPEGKAKYAKRKKSVEPVWGHIKEIRGFRRFMLRGLAKVTGEATFAYTVHNLMKLFSHHEKMGKASEASTG